MSHSSTAQFRGSDHALFSPEQIQRLMRIEFDRAQRYKYPLVCMLIAVDRLHQLQDLYGFQVRERVMQGLTNLLKATTRSSDALGCRVDQKLLVLVPHTPPEGAGIMARRLLDAVRRMKFECDGRQVRVTLSIGGAHNQRPSELAFETLLEVAEGGLAVASAGGGDRYVHSDLYEFFEKKRQREAVAAAHAAPIAPTPAPATPAPSVLNGLAGKLLGEKIRELFGVNGDDQGLLARIEQEVVAAAINEMKAELERKLAANESEYQSQIDLLQRRIAKLSRSLGLTEEELQRVLRAKSIDPGLASIYQSVQGLSSDEVQAELKRALMEKIFEANLELRKKFTPQG